MDWPPRLHANPPCCSPASSGFPARGPLRPDAAQVFENAEAAEELRDAGVLVHPLSWHSWRPGPPGLVIGYAAHPPDRLREAAATIGWVARASAIA